MTKCTTSLSKAGNKKETKHHPNKAATQNHSIPLNKMKKRERDPQKWTKNVVKSLRNNGQEYVSRKCVRPARSVKERCDPKCQFECHSITDDQRQAVFNQYWVLPTVEQKRYFLASLMKTIVNNKKYVRVDESGNIKEPRRNNNSFYIRIRGEEFRVCKLFFTNTFDVSQRVIRTIITKNTEGLEEGMSDRRGKHGNHRRISDDSKERIVAFLKSVFPSGVNYENGKGKSVTNLHRDFIEQSRMKNLQVVSYASFHGLYKHYFN